MLDKALFGLTTRNDEMIVRVNYNPDDENLKNVPAGFGTTGVLPPISVRSIEIEDEVRSKAAGKLAEFGIELLGKCERERDPNQFKRRNIQSRSEQMLSASLIRENEKLGIASRGLLFDRAPDGGWRRICLSAKRRRRSAVGAKCASHFHPQKPLAPCAGHR